MAMPMPMPISEEPVSSTRPTARKPSPDEEAMLLMMKVVERAQVAKSFAKIAAGLLTVTAAHATAQLRSVSRFERVRKIARAATAAAVHVATKKPEEPAAQDPAPREAQETEGSDANSPGMDSPQSGHEPNAA
jgi:hypothetical protein